MDVCNKENSDSDSGESWTILDHSPVSSDDIPDIRDSEAIRRNEENMSSEKDEDTDGISIISDSDHDSASPCEVSYENISLEENHQLDQNHTQNMSSKLLPCKHIDAPKSMKNEADIIEENNVKHKTYVHRRNKRLSTVLNIIMLGSVITAAGVAIGHMWGAKNECTMHTTPSVNKILSNLYKLQEENAYLRTKLKELTLATNIQIQQNKPFSDKISYKPNRCKKVYEESLNNKDPGRVTKCVDNDELTENLLTQSDYEKAFINDIDKLKAVYQQNKSWLDLEIGKRMKNKQVTVKNIAKPKKSRKDINLKLQLSSDPIKKPNSRIDINLRKQLESELIRGIQNSKPNKDIGTAEEFESINFSRKDGGELHNQRWFKSMQNFVINKNGKVDSPAKTETIEIHDNIVAPPNSYNIHIIDNNEEITFNEQMEPGSLNKMDKKEDVYFNIHSSNGRKDSNIRQGSNSRKDINLKLQLEREPVGINFEEEMESVAPNKFESVEQPLLPIDKVDSMSIDKKISYAESLMSEKELKRVKRDKEEVNVIFDDNSQKKKPKRKSDESIFETFSDEEFKKDDRYNGRKSKQDRKKHDRRKSHKKLKRKNKYALWELKGDFSKDFDEWSLGSTQENKLNMMKNSNKNIQTNNFDDLTTAFATLDSDDSKRKGERKNAKFDKENSKDKNWFEKRAALRTQARKKLEHELFGETTPNNAGWYFRRMQKREQCRAKSDNTANKKMLKRSMNFKTKH